MKRIGFSVDEAAEAVGVSRDLIYDLIGDGSLPSVKLGSRRIILADDLNAYLTGLRESA